MEHGFPLATGRVVVTALPCQHRTPVTPMGFTNLCRYLLILLMILSPVGVMAGALSEDLRLANLPTTPPEQLRELASHGDVEVRQAVAMNRKTPQDVLRKLAQDSSVDVRIAVSTNLSTTEEIFFILSRDSSIHVRSVVARFEYVPASVLAAMADDESSDIRFEVAKNWNTDIATLKKLSQDPFPEVSNMATISLKDRE